MSRLSEEYKHNLLNGNECSGMEITGDSLKVKLYCYGEKLLKDVKFNENLRTGLRGLRQTHVRQLPLSTTT